MYSVSRRAAIVFLAAVCFIAPAYGLVPTANTQTFMDTHPGVKAMAQGEQLVALYGVVMASDLIEGGAHEDTDDFVEDFILDNPSAFGVDDVDLSDPDKVTIRNGKFTVYTYTQLIGDGGNALPVHGSVVKIPVLVTATHEKIGYVGIRLVDTPSLPLPDNEFFDEDDAEAVVSSSAGFGHLTTFSTFLESTAFHGLGVRRQVGFPRFWIGQSDGAGISRGLRSWRNLRENLEVRFQAQWR